MILEDIYAELYNCTKVRYILKIKPLFHKIKLMYKNITILFLQIHVYL